MMVQMIKSCIEPFNLEDCVCVALRPVKVEIFKYIMAIDMGSWGVDEK
jgi:hypothetical protein